MILPQPLRTIADKRANQRFLQIRQIGASFIHDTRAQFMATIY
jgi:hypothetical protein